MHLRSYGVGRGDLVIDSQADLNLLAGLLGGCPGFVIESFGSDVKEVKAAVDLLRAFAGPHPAVFVELTGHTYASAFTRPLEPITDEEINNLRGEGYRIITTADVTGKTPYCVMFPAGTSHLIYSEEGYATERLAWERARLAFLAASTPLVGQ